MRRLSTRLAVALVALGFAAPAIAYVCHPDPAGTRSLALHGRIVGYSLHRDVLTIGLASQGVCRVVTWDTAHARVMRSGASCRSISGLRRVVAATGVRLRSAGTVDRADRIEVLSGAGHVRRSWPLPVRAQAGTLQVAGGLVAFVRRDGSGLWVTRLKDGRTTFVGPVHAGDRPLLDRNGAAYHDDVYKHRPLDRPLLKFVPTRSIDVELARVGRPLYTSGPIRSFSVDGTRVALVVAGGAGSCDRVVFWDIPWRSAEQVSAGSGPTCAALGASGRISTVALGGARAQWVTVDRGRPMLVAADDIRCQEWVIRRLSDLKHGVDLAGIAADGSTLAYALVTRSRHSTSSQVGLVTPGYRGHDIFRVGDTVRAMSAYDGRVAVLAADGSVRVRTESSVAVRSLVARGATTVALSATEIAVTTSDDRLDIYSVANGRLLHRWILPRGATHVDLQYGIAVVTAGNAVYAVNTATGRTRRVAVTPLAVRAQIEPIGIVYAYSTRTRGAAKVIPMSRVESVLR
jgi:hypothetical protein